MAASEGRISLAAGDALGTSIYINDVILAAAAAERQSQFATVPTTDAPAEK